MGRWSQRRIGGGGGPAPVTPLTSITNATFSGTDTVRLTYNGGIDAGDFVGVDFAVHPAAMQGDLVNQVAANIIDVTFTADVDDQATITYSGTVAGIATPQTVAL